VIVAPQDVTAVVEALRMYLADAERRASTGKVGRSLVERYYNWDRVARETRDFTYEVVKGDRADRSLSLKNKKN
jgi:glycosyltransferase involved in cell wall biosynthesis